MSDSDVQEIAVGPEGLSGRETKAEYTLENTVKCPYCERDLEVLKVVRLLRTRVNFTSTLPSPGRVLACPECQKIVSAEFAGFAWWPVSGESLALTGRGNPRWPALDHASARSRTVCLLPRRALSAGRR